jgi:transcriptional regulator with XRE-family HTH domain
MLADDLRVSMKTVDAWECGRNFPSRLELLAGLEKAIGFDVCAMLREAIDEEEREEGK